MKLDKLLHKILTTESDIHKYEGMEYYSFPFVPKDQKIKTLDDLYAEKGDSSFKYLMNHYELDDLCIFYNKLPCLDWNGATQTRLHGASNKQLDELAKYISDGLYDDFAEALDQRYIEVLGMQPNNDLSHTLLVSKLVIGVTRYDLIQINVSQHEEAGYSDGYLFKVKDAKVALRKEGL